MELAVQVREKTGKAVKVLRREGLIPAELYGHGIENIHLAVPVREFIRVFREAGENTLIDVVLNDKKHHAMIHDVTFDPVTDEVASIDFFQVRLDEKITAMVPLNFTGETPAMKEEGGILVKTMHEIEVEALPNSIPHTIDADLGKITALGNSLYVRELVVPDGVEILAAPDSAVATVTEKQEEEEIPTTEASVEDIAVEGEEEKAKRDAEKETTEAKTEEQSKS